MRLSEISFLKSVEISKTFLLLSAILDIYVSDYTSASQADVDRHLELGKKLLAAGQLVDALTHFSAAIDDDPNNYTPYFQRATVYLGLGRTKSALPDLDKTIELKSDFLTARLQRANIYVKQGKITMARADLTHVESVNPGNADVHHGIENIRVLSEETEEAKDRIANYDCATAVTHLTKAIDIAPWHVELRDLRSQCYQTLGESHKAVGDLRSIVRLTNDNTKAMLKVSLMVYEMGDAEQSLTEIRECLKLDPDHKECFAHYKKVKKLVKQMTSAQAASNENRIDDCVSKTKAMKKTEPKVLAYWTRADAFACHCLANSDRASEAMAYCDTVLEREPSNLDAMCDRADARISQELYQEAIRDFQAALDIDRNFGRAREGVKKAQKLLKNSKRRDYYKILGVNRHASKRQIMKAFRVRAAKFHPDHYKGPDKKVAEKKFIDINDAKEVLTDPEKRAKFDGGEDPLDPEQQHEGGGPFGGFTFHNFDPFSDHGGGNGFEFHFG